MRHQPILPPVDKTTEYNHRLRGRHNVCCMLDSPTHTTVETGIPNTGKSVVLK